MTLQYVCRDGTLCPVINGEPLSRCGRACFSQYLYTCCNGTDLEIRPSLHRGYMTLRAENPQDAGHLFSPSSSPYPGGGEQQSNSNSNKSSSSIVDGRPMTACNLAWHIGGRTCSYCPVPAVDPALCPAGDATALSAATNAMDVAVPGGQRFFLTERWTVGYTPAHSALVPNGSTTAGFRAFQDGGFFNLLDGAWGWAACGGGGGGGKEEQMTLHVRNSTNSEELRGCVGLNLRIEKFEADEEAAWQYS